MGNDIVGLILYYRDERYGLVLDAKPGSFRYNGPTDLYWVRVLDNTGVTLVTLQLRHLEYCSVRNE